MPLSEFDLIARYFAPLAGPGGLGLTDDAACITPPPNHDLVITKDMLIAGVHFFPDDPPRAIAQKALRVNLSDLAAKGARPLGFLLGLGLPKATPEAFIAAFAAGLAEDAREFACPLLGGDTVSAPALTLSVTAFGAVPQGRMLKRQGGMPGDALYVTGTIGDAALGLQLRLNPEAAWAKALPEPHHEALLARYLMPQPRLALAPVLIRHASAAMDISDGLVGDCDKLAAHLGRSMEIAAVPLSEAVRAAIALDPALRDIALTGGDDYELLIAVPPAATTPFEREAAQAGIGFKKIGVLTAKTGKNLWREADGAVHAFASRSYTHTL